MTKHSMTRRQLLATGLASSLAAPAAFAGIHYDARPPGAAKRSLRIAHLTDVHIQPERKGDEGLAACLNHVQELEDKPDWILFGGDNVMNVDSEDGRQRADVQINTWRRVLRDELSTPHKTIIGNHDVLGMQPIEGKDWAVNAYELPGRYYAFDEKGWRFIILDSTSPEEGGYKGRIDEEQFAWLEEQLKNAPESTPVCVASHIPILAACAYFDGENEKSGNWNVPGAWMHVDARRIKTLFARHPNVRLCLSGHIHLADEVEYLGVKYACNGAVSGAWWGGAYQEFEPGYALVDLYDNGAAEVSYAPYGWEAKA